MKEKILETLAGLGIRHAGVCAFAALPPLLPGRSAGRLPRDPQSVIACAFPYYGDFPRRNVALYAVWDDYHTTVGGLLGAGCDALAAQLPGGAFVPFVDVSPIREVAAARLAGLGPVGRHRQLILPGHGSFCFLGGIVTDLELEPDAPVETGCPDCGACIRACPTGALSGGGFDPTRCRSAITQKKGELTPWEQEQIRLGRMAWGCDLCQEACPLNRGIEPVPPGGICKNPTPLLTQESLGELMKVKAYGYRGRGVLLRNLTLLEG